MGAILGKILFNKCDQFAKRITVFLFFIIISTSLTALDIELVKSPLVEVWAYLLKNEESYLPPNLPITDLAYFSAQINAKGELYGVPSIEKVSKLEVRKHLVVAEVSNMALMHFVLSPDYPMRNKLVQDIIDAAKPFDGVQIDFEAVPSYDRENYFTFISMLKTALSGKVLSVALPARYKDSEDAYNYKRISELVDRVIVMAYDEHWSGSEAGSIASMEWSSKVSTFAAKTIGSEKLIMGLPFYGRAWGDKNPAQAYKFTTTSKILKEKTAELNRDKDGIPFFKYSETVNLILYFEDSESLTNRVSLYKKNQVNKISFWRLGQEDPTIWEAIKSLD